MMRSTSVPQESLGVDLVRMPAAEHVGKDPVVAHGCHDQAASASGSGSPGKSHPQELRDREMHPAQFSLAYAIKQVRKGGQITQE